MLIALIAGKTAVTDPLATIFLAARIVQSDVHLGSIRYLRSLSRCGSRRLRCRWPSVSSGPFACLWLDADPVTPNPSFQWIRLQNRAMRPQSSLDPRG